VVVVVGILGGVVVVVLVVVVVVRIGEGGSLGLGDLFILAVVLPAALAVIVAAEALERGEGNDDGGRFLFLTERGGERSMTVVVGG
jgi:hypothetical protein